MEETPPSQATILANAADPKYKNGFFILGIQGLKNYCQWIIQKLEVHMDMH